MLTALFILSNFWQIFSICYWFSNLYLHHRLFHWTPDWFVLLCDTSPLDCVTDISILTYQNFSSFRPLYTCFAHSSPHLSWGPFHFSSCLDKNHGICLTFLSLTLHFYISFSIINCTFLIYLKSSLFSPFPLLPVGTKPLSFLIGNPAVIS